MKLQRHRVDNDRGEWCLSEDVDELEAENESLRAEIERLKALERNRWMIYGKLVGPLSPPEV
ncbi:MAG: hypothetical protein M0T84_01620 [Betaproteobacteria bacterium]|nr:hypothetical protein [Betaproteobacteria bacterium]